MVDDLQSVAGIAAAVADRRVRAVDVLNRHVARHRETHAALNALVQTRHAAAAEEASRVEVAALPLAGVPVSVKECFPVRGLLTTLGIARRAGCRDESDAWLVERLRAAGAVIVGKGNVPQAMYLHETDNPVWGRTIHPRSLGRGPGGSSGGDAALVAAGVVPLAVGTDLAGSIRQPAHACGIAGIVPRSTLLGEGGAFDTMPHLRAVRPRAGFLARSSSDLERALQAVCPEVLQTARRGRPLRIGWWDDAGPLEPSPAVRRGVSEAVARLQSQGVETERLDGAIAREAAFLQLAILSADGGADIRRLFAGERPIPQIARLLALARLPRLTRPGIAAVARVLGRDVEVEALSATGPRSDAAVGHLLQARERLAAKVSALASRCDAFLCPVSAVPALRHGTAATLVVAAAPCLLANLLDLAAGSVPVTQVRPDEEAGRGASRDPVVRAAIDTDAESRGLPVGVQVIGLDGGEATVLEVMRLIETDG